MPNLVVIVGPIASGKSTVAAMLGARLRAAGRTVAVLDVDHVVDTIGGFRGLPPERFRQAQVVTGELVATWLGRDVDVIAHGPYFQQDENQALLHGVPAAVTPRRVQLLATYEIALERATNDPATRDLSRNPEFLRRTYDRVETLLATMPPSDWTFDTAVLSCEQITDIVASALLAADSPIA